MPAGYRSLFGRWLGGAGATVSTVLPGTIYTEQVLLQGLVWSSWAVQMLVTQGYGDFGTIAVCPFTATVVDNGVTATVVDNGVTAEVVCS